MIKYTLKCGQGHQFESWFANAAAFDALSGAGHLSCGLCADTSIEKAIMAPRVQIDSAGAQEASNALSDPQSEGERALAALRHKVEENAEFVGPKFSDEARAMHLGDSPARAIYGEANLEQAKSLIEDGVPVVPLPFAPKRKVS